MRKIFITAVLMLTALIASAQAQNVYKASLFGIKSNGVYDNTASIQAAVNFISSKGGGTLEFNVGRYLTGAVELKSGVDINIREGAVIVATDVIYGYKGKKAVFWAEGQSGIKVWGTGVVDGRGSLLLASVAKQKDLGHITDSTPVPALFHFKDCKDITLERLLLRNPATAQMYIVEGGTIKDNGCYSDTDRTFNK